MTNKQEYISNLILPRKLYNEIEQKVVSLYVRHNIKIIPIDPFEIAAASDYILRPYSELNHEARNLLRSTEKSGTSYFDPRKSKYVICYDDAHILSRQKFTVIHEIGHIDMGHKHGSQLAEEIANHYAAYALAPSPLINKYNCEDFKDIAKIFDISDDCAYFRFASYKNWIKYKIKKNYEKDLLDFMNN